MTVVDFCRSEHGTGINQSKLYRKLRRFVLENAVGDLYEDAEDFPNYGFRVEEDDQAQLRYDIYRPDLFRELAGSLASGREVELSPSEHAIMVQALQDFRNVYYGEDEHLQLVDRETGRLAKGDYDVYFSSLSRIITKLAP